ncbi:CHAP domain-containing protein [Enterobacter hormaechei]
MENLLLRFAPGGKRQYLPLQAFANGSKRAPQAGALLIWQKGGEFHETGHVAVITQLLDDRVRIAEQNVIHSRCRWGSSGRASCV